MKIPSFDRNEARWDQWNEFYTSQGSFTQFESGEVICTDTFHTRSGWGNTHNPRGHNSHYGVLTFQMSDQPASLSYKLLRDPATGLIVKRTWLPQASPMIYDEQAGRVVTLCNWHNNDSKFTSMVPSRFHNQCSVYWPGSERPPVGGAPVSYHKLTEWTKEEKAVVRERVTTIKAQARIGALNEDKSRYLGSAKAEMSSLLKYQISELADDAKWRVVKNGVTAGYTACKAEYLEVVDV